jgi:hypothetical protein
MSRLGFNIGRALSKGAQFAAGAGGADLLSKGVSTITGGSKLGGAVSAGTGIVAESLGGAHQAGAGSTLSERIRGGLSAISPQFAQAENLKSQIQARAQGVKSQQLADELTESKLEVIRQEAIDKATPFDPSSILPEGLKDVPRIQEGMVNMLRVADMDGNGSTSVSEFKKYKERAETDGSFQRSIVNFMDEQIVASDSNLKKLTSETQPLLDKINGVDAGVVRPPGTEGYKSLDDVREMLKDPAMAGTVDKKLAMQIGAIDKVENQKRLLTQGKNNAIAQMSTLQALQEAQAQKALASGGTTAFEPSKKVGAMAQALGFESWNAADTAGKKKIMDAVLANDPENKKLIQSHRKEFSAKPVIASFETVDTKFNQMDSVWEDAQSKPQDTPAQRNAVDQVLINNFNKIMDDQSVVRESEFARTAENVSFWNRMKGKVEKVGAGGSGLTDEDRQEIMNAAGIMRGEYMEKAQIQGAEFAKIAEGMGFPVDFIITNPKLRPDTIGTQGFLGQSGGSSTKSALDNFLQNPSGQTQQPMQEQELLAQPLGVLPEARNGAGAAIQNQPTIRDSGPVAGDIPFTFGGN